MFTGEKSFFGKTKIEKMIEEEKPPIKMLFDSIGRIATKMEKKGPKTDAEIVRKTEDRLRHYLETLRERKTGSEEEWGRKVSPQDLRKTSSYRWRINNGIPITHQIGEGGGCVYSPQGFPGVWSDKRKDTEKHQDLFGEKRTREGGRVINFSLSKSGETKLYQALKILKEDENSANILSIYQKTTGEEGRIRGYTNSTQVDLQNYEVYLPTNIEGVSLYIKKEEKRLFDGKKEEQINLVFDDKFLEVILAGK